MRTHFFSHSFPDQEAFLPALKGGRASMSASVTDAEPQQHPFDDGFYQLALADSDRPAVITQDGVVTTLGQLGRRGQPPSPPFRSPRLRTGALVADARP